MLWLLNHCPDEAHVFSTHARAPLLLVFEGKRVQVEEVEDQQCTETEETRNELVVDSETQEKLRRACRSYVLTPFGIAVRLKYHSSTLSYVQNSQKKTQHTGTRNSTRIQRSNRHAIRFRICNGKCHCWNRSVESVCS